MKKSLNSAESNKYSVEYIYNDSVGFKITSQLLDRMIIEAKKVNKKPKLILALNKNEKELFILDCSINIKNK